MEDQLKQYDVVWDYPSGNSSGSMPLGNGEIGINLWAVEGGDIVLYISKTDSWSEIGRLLKLGRVRIRISPNPIQPEMPFSQRLMLDRGEIRIRTGPEDAPVEVLAWVDANNPVVHVEVTSERKIDIQASLEVWRTKPLSTQGDNCYGLRRAPHPYFESVDTILAARDDIVSWFHHNPSSIWPENLEMQGLEEFAAGSKDPLLHRIFGGGIKGDTLVARDDCTLVSEFPKKRHIISIYPLTMQSEDPKAWREGLTRSIAAVESQNHEERYLAHCRWWSDFWNRSWIFVDGDEDAKVVTESYILQRFINACAGRGNYPIKFNGSIFNVDTPCGPAFNADYRRWGEPYWEQNTRLMYWSMIASGDYDLIPPLFKMYLDALPLARKRTEVFFGHEGAYFPETMYFWGAHPFCDYGWDREGKHVSDVECKYTRWLYQGNLEILALGFDHYEHTGDTSFLKDTLLPLADEILLFYARHFPQDAEGRLYLHPTQGLETYREVINSSCEVAGLIWVLERLLSLPEDLIGRERRERWMEFQAHLPPLPMLNWSGRQVVAIAERIIKEGGNVENPELYSVFPYRLFTVGKQEHEVGRATFEHRAYDGNDGWQQNDIWGAYTGHAQYAKQAIVKRYRNPNSDKRFPAFWAPGFDWTPDQDHGTVGMIALQRMLLQADSGKIVLLPAWPADWNVEFKLWAPMQTTVEGAYKDGRIVSVKVTPESRAEDLIVLEPQKE